MHGLGVLRRTGQLGRGEHEDSIALPVVAPVWTLSVPVDPRCATVPSGATLVTSRR